MRLQNPIAHFLRHPLRQIERSITIDCQPDAS